MTTRRAARRQTAPLEAGAVPTEQITDMAPLESTGPVSEPPVTIPRAVVPPTSADLTGSELAEITTRNKAVDKAATDAREARDRAVQADLLFRFGQEALTAFITRLIEKNGLDKNYAYRVDLDSGKIVPMRDLRQPQ